MSTLKTHNLQSPDAGSVNIALAPNAGMVVTGISTFTGASIHVGLSQFQNTINLTHASAGQNYIYFTEDLQFAKNGTGTRLKIDSSGRLLVGRTSGSFAIDVQTGSDSTFRISNSGESGHGSHDAKIVAGGSYYQNPNIVGSTIKFGTYNGSAEGERLRITSTGQLLIGHSSSTSVGVGAAYNMPLQVIGNSYDTAGIVAARYAADANGPTLHFVKSRNATKGSQTIVQVDDTLGFIRWYGSDGTDTTNAAAMIGSYCDATPASDKIPGRLSFWTTDTLTYPRERLRIDSAGKLFLGDGTYNSNSNGFKMSIKESSNENAAIMFLDTDNMKGGICGIAKGNNQIISGTTNVDFVLGSVYADTHIITGTPSNQVGMIGMTIKSDSGKIGIDGQSSPQAKLHIGNYETTQNENQSSVTQYFIDSTKSLKIARCNRGSVSNAGWYDVAVLANSGYSYRCQVSIGGNFTQDVVDIDIQMAYGTTLGNKYSMQIHAKSACAHSNDRITHVRVAEKSNVFYLQVYLQNVNSQVNGKSVLETTCGIYAQNGADNAYPMFAAASGSYSNICTTFPDFGVHASWDMTVNSSGVRSYTALTGGSQVYVTAENAGSGTGSHGTVGRFTAPMRGLYQVNLNAKAILTPNKNQNILLSMYGSMTYDAQNVWTTNSEVYDPRGATTGAQGQQGEGNSWYLRMAAYDYFSIDWYRPAATGYINGGGDTFNISILKMG